MAARETRPPRLTAGTKCWRTHPVVLMWQGYEAGLAAYQQSVCAEWTSRGFADTCRAKTDGLLATAHDSGHESGTTPPWMGVEALHLSHQSNLVRKDPAVYGPVFPGVPDDLPYVWPVTPPEPVKRRRGPAASC